MYTFVWIAKPFLCFHAPIIISVSTRKKTIFYWKVSSNGDCDNIICFMDTIFVYSKSKM